MRLFIITGPPASGKSTVSNKMSEMFDKSALLEGDLVYDMVKKGIEVPWNSEKHVNLAFRIWPIFQGISFQADLMLFWTG